MGESESKELEMREDWTGEDPGTCTECGKAFQLVRPGKSQPMCGCWETSSRSGDK